MQSEAEKLLETYNEFRRKTHHYQENKKRNPFLKDLVAHPKNGPDRLAQLDQLIIWCHKENIDPERWLYTMFSCHKWLHAPAFNKLIPKNKKRSKTYSMYFSDRETPEWHRVVSEKTRQRQQSEGRIFDPNRDLSASAESLKKQYLAAGDPHACMRDTHARTYGYHPKSTTCARCPIAYECSYYLQQSVPFDILALRRGEITSEQARMAAAAARSQHVSR